MNTHSQRRLSVEGLEARRLLAVEILLTGSGELLNLPLTQLTDVAKVDICGTGDNTVVVDADWVSQSCPDGCVDIIADSGDHIEVTDTTWKFEDAVAEEGAIVRQFKGGDATLRLVGPDDLTNPLRVCDVNGNGEDTAWDVNLIINELHARLFSDREDGSLVDPMKMPLDKFNFYDISGNGKITSHDALLAINALGVQQTRSDAEAAAISVVLPLQILASDPVISQRIVPYDVVETFEEEEDQVDWNISESPVDSGDLTTLTPEDESTDEAPPALDSSIVDELVQDPTLASCIDESCIG